ncbi:helicase [Enterobacterales bacterium CwR94]|nr:helicase [Enterobacterales bacterium CwR94]
MLNIKPNVAQERALGTLRAHWKQERTFLVYSPTGSGKTGLAAFIVDGMVSRGMRIMFAAPYTILLNQTATRFIEYGLNADDIGYVWAEADPRYVDGEKKIQIASIDTLIRREFPDNIDLLIVDEAHMRRKRLLEYIRDSGVKVIGLSGTPFATFMGNYYERLIKPTTMKELIASGVLSSYEFYAPTKPNLNGVKTITSDDYGSDYNESQIAEIMCGADLVGDIVKNWLENGRNLPTICFCVNVSHANYLTMAFVRAGISAEVMTAETPQEDRQQTIKRFEKGATKLLINVGVLVAGFDSDVRCVIYARPTKSEIRWLQCIGRGLRTAPGKDACLIFDHSGTVHRLGYPDEIEYNELLTKSDGLKETRKQQQKEREEKLPKECGQCHFMKPVGVYECPQCGFKPIMGEDVETDETRNIKKMKKDKNAPTQEQKQSWWSQILYYRNHQESLGKKRKSDAWCANTFKDKFGTWPRNLSDFPQQITPEVQNFIKSKNIAWAKSRKAQHDAKNNAAPEQQELGLSRGQRSLKRIREMLDTRKQGADHEHH